MHTNLDSDEVLKRFAHLETSDVQVSSVEKIVDPLSVIIVSLCNHTAQ
jgi:hypothetical protein